MAKRKEEYRVEWGEGDTVFLGGTKLTLWLLHSKDDSESIGEIEF